MTANKGSPDLQIRGICFVNNVGFVVSKARHECERFSHMGKAWDQFEIMGTLLGIFRDTGFY